MIILATRSVPERLAIMIPTIISRCKEPFLKVNWYPWWAATCVLVEYLPKYKVLAIRIWGGDLSSAADSSVSVHIGERLQEKQFTYGYEMERDIGPGDFEIGREPFRYDTLCVQFNGIEISDLRDVRLEYHPASLEKRAH